MAFVDHILFAKRIIQENTASNGSLNADSVANAIMQYRNTTLPGMSLSPAQILFHRTLRDFTPSHPNHYELHKDWILSSNQIETLTSVVNHLHHAIKKQHTV